MHKHQQYPDPTESEPKSEVDHFITKSLRGGKGQAQSSCYFPEAQSHGISNLTSTATDVYGHHQSSRQEGQSYDPNYFPQNPLSSPAGNDFDQYFDPDQPTQNALSYQYNPVPAHAPNEGYLSPASTGPATEAHLSLDLNPKSAQVYDLDQLKSFHHHLNRENLTALAAEGPYMIGWMNQFGVSRAVLDTFYSKLNFESLCCHEVLVPQDQIYAPSRNGTMKRMICTGIGGSRRKRPSFRYDGQDGSERAIMEAGGPTEIIRIFNAIEPTNEYIERSAWKLLTFFGPEWES